MRVGRLLALASVILLATAACQGPEKEVGGRDLAEGDQAPAFSLPSAEGGQVSLVDFVGSKPVLLYFSMGPG